MANCNRVPNSMSEIGIERLGQFFGAYFHQDCFLDAPDWVTIVEEFVQDHSEARVLAELADLIDGYAEQHDDETLDDLVLDELGCYYCPSSEGITMRDWLHRVSDLLRTYAAG